jgi:hypothetical protein
MGSRKLTEEAAGHRGSHARRKPAARDDWEALVPRLGSIGSATRTGRRRRHRHVESCLLPLRQLTPAAAQHESTVQLQHTPSPHGARHLASPSTLRLEFQRHTPSRRVFTSEHPCTFDERYTSCCHSESIGGAEHRGVGSAFAAKAILRVCDGELRVLWLPWRGSRAAARNTAIHAMPSCSVTGFLLRTHSSRRGLLLQRTEVEEGLTERCQKAWGR